MSIFIITSKSKSSVNAPSIPEGVPIPEYKTREQAELSAIDLTRLHPDKVYTVWEAKAVFFIEPGLVHKTEY